MGRRTNKQIEEDFEKIRQCAAWGEVKTLEDIGKKLGLSVSAVKNSLKLHPRIEKKILATLKTRAEEATQAKEAKIIQKEESKPKQVKKNPIGDNKSTLTGGFVLDASTTGHGQILERLTQIFATKLQVILTSVTVRELDQLQKINDEKGMRARHILADAARNKENYVIVQIEDGQKDPDGDIIDFCVSVCDKFTLLTCDKVMALRARGRGVKAHYFDIRESENVTVPIRSKPATAQKEITFDEARQVGNKWFATAYYKEAEGKMIVLLDKDNTLATAERELHEGDSIYIIKKYFGYINFCHLEVVRLGARVYCKQVFFKRLYDKQAISILPDKYGYWVGLMR